MPPGDRPFQILVGRIGLDQQAGLARIGHSLGVADQKIRPKKLAMLGDGRFDRLRDRLPFGQHVVAEAERLPQHEVDPGAVDGRLGTWAILVVFPLLECHVQGAEVFRVMRIEALGEDLLQHRHGQKRAGDFNQREPFGVMVFGGHSWGFYLTGPSS